MDDRQISFETKLVGLDANRWLGTVDDICDEFGFFEQLGSKHFAGFLEAGNNLLVTFENAESVRAYNIDAEPRGFAYARHDGWSHLALISFTESWFRDPAIFAFFDRLVDDGFFERFENVLFYGGDGGAAYAASAYSVASPGATVIALRPQATLAARSAGWDRRYRFARKQNFASRYGYAPEMIDAAREVFIAYDPYEHQDACHAALFRKPHVTLLPCPLLGDQLDRALDRMGIHDIMLKLAMDKSLTGKRFQKLLRARRYDQTYVRRLVEHLLAHSHDGFAEVICQYMLKRGSSIYFEKKLARIRAERVE
ncbi:MAG: phosphoadenosine phosphosulfate reductase [Yoonia sp.]|uniref:phosphoadenosine phosphosulfate reductase n=1 Tax=Yoonia sp. TaxID=2212373 RepID=UPI003EF69600